MNPSRAFLQRFLLAAAVLLVPATESLAQGDASKAPRVVLKGYDPVAYFTEGKPVKGDPKISHDWDGERYLFSNPGNRSKFAADPERYAPQFGGFCTASMARGARNEGNPEAWAIVDGKLYVTGAPDTAAAARQRELMQTDRNYLALRIPQAEANWREKK